MKAFISILSVAAFVSAQSYSSSASSSEAAASSSSASISSISNSASSASITNSASTVSGSASVTNSASTASNSASVTNSASTPSSTAGTTPSPPSFQVPSSIAPECSAFLNALNGAPEIQTCTAPLLKALSGSKASISDVCTTAASSGCSESLLRTWLTHFSGNCTQDLVTKPNKDVVELYDVLYVVKPFSNAVCAKDQNNNYCLSGLTKNTTANGAAGAYNAAQTPLTNSDGIPDADAFSAANILWLGANKDMDATALCTPCHKSMLTSYIQWESATPLANGIANSPLLSSQAPLWAAVQKTCPADFISGTLANAGAAPGSANGAATFSPAKGVMAMLAIVAASAMTL